MNKRGRITPERALETVRNANRTLRKVLNVIDKLDLSYEESVLFVAIISVRLERHLAHRVMVNSMDPRALSNPFKKMASEIAVRTIHGLIHHQMREYAEAVSNLMESADGGDMDKTLEMMAVVLEMLDDPASVERWKLDLDKAAADPGDPNMN